VEKQGKKRVAFLYRWDYNEANPVFSEVGTMNRNVLTTASFAFPAGLYLYYMYAGHFVMEKEG